MRIDAVSIVTFGGVNSTEVSFAPGMNVVLGDNESGKTTIFRSIQHLLLTRTDLDKRSLRSELGPYFPRPGGNFAESSISISGASGGTTTIRKRWGEDAEEEALLPDGSRVRGAAGVNELLSGLLPVTPATFRTVMLADQAALDQTRELLSARAEVRDETAEALRRAQTGTGGVPPEVFLRTLSARIDALLGRWDWERQRPEGGRGLAERWKKGAGELVQAYYLVKQKEELLRELERAESALDEANRHVEEAVSSLSGVDVFVSKYAGAYAELNSSRGLAAEIDAARQRLEGLRADNRRWPVVTAEVGEGEKELRRLEETKNQALAQLTRIRSEQKAAELQKKTRKAEELQSDLAAAEATLEAAAPVDQSALARLREVEQQLPYAEARLASGSLRVVVSARESTSLGVERDGNESEKLTLHREESHEVTASRQVVLDLDQLRVEIEGGEERFTDVKKAYEKLARERDALAKQLVAGTATEAESRLRERKTAAEKVSGLRGDLCELLDVADIGSAESALRVLLAEADAAGHVATGPSESAPSQESLTEEIRQISEKRGELSSAITHGKAEVEALVARHGSQEGLENALGEANRRLAELEEKESAHEVPAGFGSTAEFLAEYETQLEKRESAAGEAQQRRLVYAELVGSQAEQTSEEVRAELQEAEREFERLRSETETLLRVRRHAAQVAARLDGELYLPFARKVAEYARLLTQDAYVPDSGQDPVNPDNFSATGLTLPYELLSQGTRDSLALAVRLALAETALAGDSAPFIMDDPLVDMDPERRTAAATAIADFARCHQVIFFTCHPEHAALFEGAERSPLSRVKRYVKGKEHQEED